MNSGTRWAKIIIPPDPERLRIAQEGALNIARSSGLSERQCGHVELAIEEVFLTILNQSAGEEDEAEVVLDIRCALSVFQVHIRHHGMPFDLAGIPEYDPEAGEEANDGGLSFFLLKNTVDRYRVINQGKDGMRFELEWFLPAGHIADMEKASGTDAAAAGPVDPIREIRLLGDADAVDLSRLVYRSYGYSYVYEDIYYPDRIRANLRRGLIKSWGALAASGRMGGHLALMKESPDAPAVEWGIAVVDPLFRSDGLMKKLLGAAVEDMERREEPVFFAHAVTSHPYTQKTCHRFGFHPTALLVCYATDTLRFRGISEHLGQRESTFLAVRLMHDLPVQRIYPPPWHEETLSRLFCALNLSFERLRAPGTDGAALPQEEISSADCTLYTSHTVQSVNIAHIFIDRAGADFSQRLHLEQRRLCRERVDMIYLSVDLADPMAPDCVRMAERAGFFLAGFTPMMHRPYSLTLQYMNNLKVNYDAIHTDGELAGWLRDTVAREQARVDSGW